VSLRTHAGVTSPLEYVARLVETIGLPLQPPLPIHPSPLSLPEAIDYLNSVWRAGVGNGTAPIRISRADAAAKLTLECATADEFESRLGVFAGILGQLRVPPEKGDKKLWGEFSKTASQRERKLPSTYSLRRPDPYRVDRPACVAEAVVPSGRAQHKKTIVLPRRTRARKPTQSAYDGPLPGQEGLVGVRYVLLSWPNPSHTGARNF